jgi:hypothetical protein
VPSACTLRRLAPVSPLSPLSPIGAHRFLLPQNAGTRGGRTLHAHALKRPYTDQHSVTGLSQSRNMQAS